MVVVERLREERKDEPVCIEIRITSSNSQEQHEVQKRTKNQEIIRSNGKRCHMDQTRITDEISITRNVLELKKRRENIFHPTLCECKARKLPKCHLDLVKSLLGKLLDQRQDYYQLDFIFKCIKVNQKTSVRKGAIRN